MEIYSFSLAHSAKLPTGLYILPMFFSLFFSPLSKLAGEAIYFADVFIYLFVKKILMVDFLDPVA